MTFWPCFTISDRFIHLEDWITDYSFAVRVRPQLFHKSGLSLVTRGQKMDPQDLSICLIPNGRYPVHVYDGRCKLIPRPRPGLNLAHEPHIERKHTIPQISPGMPYFLP